MHFSRQMAAFVRGGIPIMDGIDVIAEGTKNKRFRKILLDINEADPRGRAVRRRARRAHRDPAAVLPRHHPHRRADRPPRHRAGAALRLHRARPRGQEQAQVGTDVPARSCSLMSIVTVNILMIFVLPKFVDFFDDLGAKLPLSTRMLMAVGEVLEGVLVRLPARRPRRSSSSFLWMQKTSAGNAVRDRVLLRMPLVEGHRPLLGDRAHSAGCSARCRRPACRSPKESAPRSTASKNTVFEAQAPNCAGAHPRRRGARRADRRRRSCSLVPRCR